MSYRCACSRVLISTFNFNVACASASGLNLNTKCIEWLALSRRQLPSHDRVSRVASMMAPIGSFASCTRSMSSE